MGDMPVKAVRARYTMHKWYLTKSCMNKIGRMLLFPTHEDRV